MEIDIRELEEGTNLYDEMMNLSPEVIQDMGSVYYELVKCEICTEIIGRVNMGVLKKPMEGWMFLSKDEHHNFPPPFFANAIWETMRCPYCRKRPFQSIDYFKNDKNILVEVPDVEDSGTCSLGE